MCVLTPCTSICHSVATSQGYNSSGLLLVLPVDFAEENFLQRVRYKLENLYPAQRDFAVCQLLNHVSVGFNLYKTILCV